MKQSRTGSSTSISIDPEAAAMLPRGKACWLGGCLHAWSVGGCSYLPLLWQGSVRKSPDVTAFSVAARQIGGPAVQSLLLPDVVKAGRAAPRLRRRRHWSTQIGGRIQLDRVEDYLRKVIRAGNRPCMMLEFQVTDCPVYREFCTSCQGRQPPPPLQPLQLPLCVSVCQCSVRPRGGAGL